jgi:phosphohistidine phosphatase SixA
MRPVQIIFIRHGQKEKGVNDEEAPLTEHSEEKVRKLAVLFRDFGVKPDHYFTSTYLHTKDTAKILYNYLSVNGSQIIEVEALTPIPKTAGQFNLENIIDRAHVHNVFLQSPFPKTLAFVGHEGRLSQLITRVSGKRLRPLDHLDAVCVEAESFQDLRLGRGKVVWRIPVKEYQEEELRKKITAKTTIATVLAGFTFTALFLTLRDISLPQGLAEMGTITQTINTALPLLATVCLTAAMALFIAAVYIYDILTMPEGFWFTSQQTEWKKLPSIVQKNKEQHGLLYGHMIDAWVMVFTPGVIFAAIGFLLIVVHKTSLFSLVYLAIILGIVAYYWWRRPKLGVD